MTRLAQNRLMMAALGCALLLAASGCQDRSEPGDAKAAGDATPHEVRSFEAGPEASRWDKGLPFADFYQEVQSHLDEWLFDAGCWTEDFGDASFWGPAFLVHTGLESGDEKRLEKGMAAFDWNLALLEKAGQDLGVLLGETEEVLMAALGIIEVLAATDSTEGLETLDSLLDLVNSTVEGFGTYLDVDIESYALETYGPTVVTGVVALLNLRYAELLDTARRAARIQSGLKVIEAIDKVAWNGLRYRVRPDDDWIEIYPNVIMIIANGTAFRVTGEERFRQRCLDVYAGIQPLKDKVKLNYRSPYSAEYMGAQTDDYSTLSSQNYVILSLSMLYELTGEDAYRSEIKDVAAFIEDYLYQDGRILHHWMDGKIAEPTDPEYFCSGCNLQFLYVAWYAEHFVFVP